MDELKAVHQCLFCQQTFGSAADKDDHILEHFAQETCSECDENLIRIGGYLYVRHNEATCIKKVSTSEENVESCTVIESIAATMVCDPLEYDELSTATNPMTLHTRETEMPNIKTESVNCYQEDEDILMDINGLESTIQENEIQPPAADLASRFPYINLNPVVVLEDILKKTTPEHCIGIEIKEEAIGWNSHAYEHHDEQQLQSHLSICKNKKETKKKYKSKIFECFVCHKILKNKCSVINHLKTIHHEKGKQFKCETCGLSYFFRCHLQFHINVVHLKIRQYVCGMCEKSFKTNGELRIHEYVHTGQKPFKCKYGCEKYFEDYKTRREHYSKHTGIEPYRCSIDGCDRRFDCITNLRQHKAVQHVVYTSKRKSKRQSKIHLDLFDEKEKQQTEHPDDSNSGKSANPHFKPIYPCSKCDEFFQSEQALSEHLSIHGNDKRTFKCTYAGCEKRFKNRQGRKLHLNSHTDEVHVCKINGCGRHFKFRSILGLHQTRDHSKPLSKNQERTHQEDQGLDQADEQGREPILEQLDQVSTFILKQIDAPTIEYILPNDDEPMRQNTISMQDLAIKLEPIQQPDGENTVENIEQNYEYIKVEELTIEPQPCEVQNQQETEHSCDNCGKKFFSRSSKECHMKRFHTGSGFSCQICKKIFSSRDSLRYHNYRTHKAKKYKCELCEIWFHSESEVERHTDAIHLKIRKFKCEQCEMTFKYKNNLTAHRRSHTSEKSYACKNCAEIFNKEMELRKHMLVKHLI
ncbi:zinc finger protein 62-like isoform X2 [Sitodiplosis mosellana]|uniref:zinc finger protein 62-like isoform X2 n=1 Tax=Sitodiplosis mosellana TaxID=263140 RepID=UPI002443BB68|nr:zinc finger protein 62-like isoform X2 [Sitodiplosis mosellana]